MSTPLSLCYASVGVLCAAPLWSKFVAAGDNELAGCTPGGKMWVCAAHGEHLSTQVDKYAMLTLLLACLGLVSCEAVDRCPEQATVYGERVDLTAVKGTQRHHTFAWGLGADYLSSVRMKE